MISPTERRYIPPNEAAEILSTSPEMVRRMLRRGELDGIKLGRAWRVDAWSLGGRPPRGGQDAERRG
jgi:excisionase family DNA binding protein